MATGNGIINNMTYVGKLINEFIIVNEGASLMSSVSGLKEPPHTEKI